MVRWLKVFYLISLILIFTFFVMIFLYTKENIDIIVKESSGFLQTNYIEKEYFKIYNIRELLINEANFLLKTSKESKIKNIKRQLNDIEIFLSSLKNSHKKFIYLNNFLSKKNIDFSLQILNNNKEVIVDNNFLNIGKKEKLICNPFRNYGSCETIIDNKYILIKYIPLLKVFLVATYNFNNLRLNYSEIETTLESLPYNLIIYKNGKLIKGKIDNNHFYIFEYFAPLKIFFGEGISYAKLNNFSKTLGEDISNKIKHHYFKLAFFMSLLMIIYLSIATYLFFKIKNTSKKIENDIIHDKLTGVLNRKGLEKYFDESKKFLLLDLDNFKYINDTFGHEKGDEILRYFSLLLKEYFPKDIIARWGGDEFIILSNEEREKIRDNIEKINILLEKKQKEFDKDAKIILSLSCGGSVAKTKEEKFKEADLALYKVKKTTKRGCVFYDELDYIKIEF